LEAAEEVPSGGSGGKAPAGALQALCRRSEGASQALCQGTAPRLARAARRNRANVCEVSESCFGKRKLARLGDINKIAIRTVFV